MRILLTGASSFTGLWFAQTLAAAGHTVVAPLKSKISDYSGLRAQRVAALIGVAEVIENAPFGSRSLLNVVSTGSWDVLCQHAAQTGDYRNPDFDVLGAAAANTHLLGDVVKTMLARGLGAIVLTGTVFEQDEGSGDAPLRAFSPYGLSKGMTWQYYRFLCQTIGFPLGKFVIPNPFGPFEEPRFCNYLVQAWLRGGTPTVRTPLYVRDNIHVDLLAHSYAAFVEKVACQKGIIRINPSSHVESQGAFAKRFAAEMEPRLGLSCPVVLLPQTEFSEPMVRINMDRVDGSSFDWNEGSAWDAEADFYKRGTGLRCLAK